MVCARIAGSRGGRLVKLPLSVRVSREIGSKDSNFHAVSRIRLGGNAVLAASPSPIAVVIVAPRGWFDHLLQVWQVSAPLNSGGGSR